MGSKPSKDSVSVLDANPGKKGLAKTGKQQQYSNEIKNVPPVLVSLIRDKAVLVSEGRSVATQTDDSDWRNGLQEERNNGIVVYDIEAVDNRHSNNGGSIHTEVYERTTRRERSDVGTNTTVTALTNTDNREGQNEAHNVTKHITKQDRIVSHNVETRRNKALSTENMDQSSASYSRGHPALADNGDNSVSTVNRDNSASVDNKGHLVSADNGVHSVSEDNRNNSALEDNNIYSASSDTKDQPASGDNRGHLVSAVNSTHLASVYNKHHPSSDDHRGRSASADNRGHSAFVDNSGHPTSVENRKYLASENNGNHSEGIVVNDISLDRFGKYKVRVESDKEKCTISAVAFLDSGDMVLIDRSNRKIKFVDAEFRYISAQDLPAQPWAVCAKGVDVYVTIGNTKIQHLYVKDMLIEPERTLEVKGRCLGMCMFGEYIAVGLQIGEVHLLDTVGEKHGTIRLPVLDNGKPCNPWHLHTSNEGNLLVTDSNAAVVFCLDKESQVVFSFKEMSSPRGTTLDSRGNIIVVGRDDESGVVVKIVPRDWELKGMLHIEQQETSRCKSLLKWGELEFVPYCADYRNDDTLVLGGIRESLKIMKMKISKTVS